MHRQISVESSSGPVSVGSGSRKKKRRSDSKTRLVGGSAFPTVGGVLREYLRESTVHGLKFLLEPRWWQKAFWIIAIIIATFFAVYFNIQVFLKWRRDPIYVAFDTQSTPMHRIPFPAITICNMNQVNLATVRDLGSGLEDLASGNLTATTEEREWLKLRAGLLQNMCPDIHYGLARDQIDIQVEAGDEEEMEEFLDGLGQPCESMMKKCTIMGVEKDCSELFKTAFIDLGLCCSFNILPEVLVHDKPFEKPELSEEDDVWNPQDGFKRPPRPVSEDEPLEVPFRSLSSGVTNGASFILDIERDSYGCPTHSSSGFKVMLHSTTSNPFMIDHGQILATGREHFVSATPEVVQANSGLYGISPDDRKCYLYNEKKLAFYRHYTEENCYTECSANYTYSVCECVPHYLPHFSGQFLCNPNQVKCYQKLKLEIRDKAALEEGGIYKGCDCIQGCSEISYSDEVSSAPLDPESVRRTLNDTELGDEYIRDNYAKVNVFFKTPTVTQHERGELFGVVDFVSNVGGLMGLFLGFSAISLMEVVYYLGKAGFVSALFGDGYDNGNRGDEDDVAPFSQSRRHPQRWMNRNDIVSPYDVKI